MPLFSVIVIHYQGAIPRAVFARGMDSVQKQTFKDFEILCYHDGPLLDPEAPQPVPIRCTEKRFNDTGHSLRDIGMREARGEYIVLFNADNILYPHALETIAAEIRRPPRVFDRLGNPGDSNNIIIFPIIMNDYQRLGTHQVRLPAGSGAGMIFTGNPPQMGLIDCMQFVMKRELWLAVGGWYDKRPASDGFMYPEVAARFGYRAVCPVLGEHF